MKNTYLVILIVASLGFFSCQKVIDIDLNAAASKYVIEGGLNDLGDPCQIRIIKTKNFSADNDFEGISNAFVTISDNAGNLDTLTYVSQGVYQNPSIVGMPGVVYYLTVKIDGETFTSTSQMPYTVNMDSLYSENFIGFVDTVKLIVAAYNDPIGVKNYYRYELSINNEIKKNLFLNDDELTDGNVVSRGLFFRSEIEEENIKAGDSVSVEFQCIDKDVYHYFFTLEKTIGQSDAAPTNPVSNISGGALGYFSAYTSQKKSIKIQ